MSSLLNVVLDSILKAKSSANTTTSTTAATDANAPNFATVLSQLNIKVNAASMTSQSGDVKSFLNTNSTSSSLNIDAIVQQVLTAKKNGSTLSTDSLIKQYLVKNFGGSEQNVIMQLAGVQSLPSQSTALQSIAFNNLISKISTQVRTKINNQPEVSEEINPDADLSSILDDNSSPSIGSSSDNPYM